MRSRRIEVVTFLVVLALVASAVTVAALRSRPGAAGAPPTANPASTLSGRGAALFQAECGPCHSPGRTVAGGGRYLSPGGRQALVDLLLTGEVVGEPGTHPDFAYLDDADLAALAGHLLASWAGHPQPAVEREEFAVRRSGEAD